MTAGTSGVLTESTAGGEPTGANARTVEAWVKTTSSSIMAVAGYGAGSNPYEFLVAPGFISLEDPSGGGDVRASSPYSLNDGNWHYIAATYDGTTNVVFYVDGQQIAAKTFSVAANTSGTVPFTVGSWNGGNFFSGSIDEVALYPSALTQTQITTHWAAGLAASCPTTPTGYGGTRGGRPSPPLPAPR